MTVLCVRLEPWGQVTEEGVGAQGARWLAGSQPVVPTQQVRMQSPGPPGSSDSKKGQVVSQLCCEAGKSLGAGKQVSKMICRERFADRVHACTHTHSCVNAQAHTCTGTHAHMCIIIAARGDGNMVVSKGFN